MIVEFYNIFPVSVVTTRFSPVSFLFSVFLEEYFLFANILIKILASVFIDEMRSVFSFSV